ncbi:hypothetical protein KI387_016339, partial [Taxus chinensis]
VQPLSVAEREGMTLEDARRVIVVLSPMNVKLMKFAEDVHKACSSGLSEGSRLKKFDLSAISALSAPVVFESEGVVGFRRKMG